MGKIEIRKSQSFTYGEVSVALEILKFAMRSNDLRVLAHRPDFISLYRKYSKMKEKMMEMAEAGKGELVPEDGARHDSDSGEDLDEE